MGRLSQLLESLVKAKRVEGNAGVFVLTICHRGILGRSHRNIVMIVNPADTGSLSSASILDDITTEEG